MLDRLLLPRIENFALNNSIAEIDEVVDFLRRSYKEYTRKQMGPFRKQVARAIDILERKGGPQKPELHLEVRRVLFINKLDAVMLLGCATAQEPTLAG